jgi:UDP-2,3-diacylglucosamine pyrophosphatase LpxH
MFAVYGAICLFGLEPAYRFMKRKGFPLLLRGLVYMVIILAMECSLGWVLFWLTGYQIWYYSGFGTILTYTSIAIGPMWFICGLVSENVIRLIDSFEALKLAHYGLVADEATGHKDNKTIRRHKIVVLSDIHIGKKAPAGVPETAWFTKIYQVWLTIILHKIARDPQVKELVFLGDLFDTWRYGPDETPPSIPEIIDSWKGAPFFDALKHCIRHIPDLYYIPGNHDMGASQADVESLSVDGRGLTVISAAAYEALPHIQGTCRVIFEHGNEGDTFNAAPAPGDGFAGLPFGYFVTRLDSADDFDAPKAITVSRNRSGSLTTADSIGTDFLGFFIDQLVHHANRSRPEDQKLNDASFIQMPGTIPPLSIAAIKRGYPALSKNLFELGDNKSLVAAASKHGLDSYARHKFGTLDWGLWFKRLFSRQHFESVVVLGHTHFARRVPVLNRTTPGLYLNSGCCCKSAKSKVAHWVELSEYRWGINGRPRQL